MPVYTVYTLYTVNTSKSSASSGRFSSIFISITVLQFSETLYKISFSASDRETRGDKLLLQLRDGQFVRLCRHCSFVGFCRGKLAPCVKHASQITYTTVMYPSGASVYRSDLKASFCKASQEGLIM